jgi:tetrahydromethanopterin S-methyltransferase subunit G
MSFDWKALPYLLPLLFITLLAVFGIIFLSGIFHEWLHTQDFETESLCIDYTNNSFMYVTTIGFKVDGNDIYLLQGLFIGILGVTVWIMFFYLVKIIVIKWRVSHEYG